VRTLVVTGFSAFPGAPANPTEALMRRLSRHAPRLARLGWRLETRVLPVVYGETAKRLADIEETLAPDVLLHFGLAGRRRWLGVELVARKRLHPLKVDAAQRTPAAPSRDGPDALRARLPAARVAAAIRATGARCMTSMDAGGYVCNQTFYLSLGRSRAARIGFVHAPPTRRMAGGFDGLERAALAALFVLLRDAPR
jgi:pyroglutamyl-peptidase